MFSDTHFHFHYLAEKNGLDAGTDLLESINRQNIHFGMDIGTECDDLLRRRDLIEQCINHSTNKNLVSDAEKWLYFSAGIWPSPEAIKNRFEQMKTLEKEIDSFVHSENNFRSHLAAIGEGGIDHHWNPSGVDGRNKEAFDTQMYEGERELFIMQLELAEKLNLPFVIHSRDGFEDTVSCIKEAGYDRGIVHCYSYGIDEAKVFLDRGWYLAFGGAVTYTKKSKMEDMKALLNYVPEDRILLETDSPYLSPVPLRGQENNPTHISYTYDFIAQIRGETVENLCDSVDRNCDALFNID